MAKTLEGRRRNGGSEWGLFIAAATLAASLCLALSGCEAVDSALGDNNERSWPYDTRSHSAPTVKHDHGGLDDDWSATLIPDSIDWWGIHIDVPIISLRVHERIDPRSIIETVRCKNLWNDGAASGMSSGYSRRMIPLISSSDLP